MNRSHLLSVSVVVVLSSLIVAIACQPAPAPASVTELKFGVGVPLSGTGAPSGILLARTYELMAADIGVFDVAGKKYQWKLVTADNLYTSAGGVQTANQFINQEGVKFMFQLGTAPAAAVQPIAEAARVIYDTGSSDRAILGPSHKYTFRTYQSPGDSFPALTAYLKQSQPQLKNWYILVSDDATGVAFEQASKPAIAAAGLNLAGVTQYPRETTDFYPVLLKALSTKPDVIITLAGDAAAVLVKQAREQGYTGKFLSGSWPPKVAEVAGPKNAEGFIVPGPDLWSDQTPKALIDVANKYQAKYGEEWGGTALSAWPTLYLVTDAIKKAGTVEDNDKIINVMETQKLDTPLGAVFYGEKEVYGIPHQLVRPIWVSEFKDGKLRTIATISPEDAAKAIQAVYK